MNNIVHLVHDDLPNTRQYSVVPIYSLLSAISTE